MAYQKPLRYTLEEIMAMSRAQRRESGRCGEGRGWEEVAESESGSEVSQYSGTETGDDQVGG